MISGSFKKRLITSLFLFLLVFFIYNSNLIFVYSLIILGVLSVIEFLIITNKIVKNKIYFFISNLIFVNYIIFFCFISLFFYSHPQLKVIIFSLLLCCAFSDIGGFIFGKLFKGPKLTKISPNKTIAGSLGSLFLSCFSLAIIFYIISFDSTLYVILIAAFTSVACQIGDLFFSFLKRKAKIKDTGNFLPGHGGILDRIDGILLGIPFGILLIINLQ